MSKFKELKVLSKGAVNRVSIVKNLDNNKLYIHKYVPLKQKEVYQKLKYIDCEHLPKIYVVKDLGSKVQVLEEYIQGATLEDTLENFGILPLAIVKLYMLEICEAVEVLHSVGIIHKDISPKNIVISDEHGAILIDFDISKQYNSNSKDTTIMGTRGYASPEHYGFQSTDERSDIYSLGVLMNVMLTGKFPSEQLHTGNGFSKIIKKCTQISPEKRYKNVNQLYNAIANTRCKENAMSSQVDNMLSMLKDVKKIAENKLFHGLYYEAIDILENQLEINFNKDVEGIYVYILSKCYENLKEFDLSAKVLIDYIHSIGKISTDSFLYKKLISLSDKLSEDILKEISNIRSNNLKK